MRTHKLKGWSLYIDIVISYKNNDIEKGIDDIADAS